MIILKFIKMKHDANMRTHSYGSRQSPVAGSCEHGSQPSVSIKIGKFLDQKSDYQLFKKDCVPWSYRLINCSFTLSFPNA